MEIAKYSNGTFVSINIQAKLLWHNIYHIITHFVNYNKTSPSNFGIALLLSIVFFMHNLQRVCLQALFKP